MIKGFLGIFHVGFWGFYVGFSYTFIVIDVEFMRRLKSDAIVMHPLPRNSEIDPRVDNDKRCVYFEQMRNGVELRKVLLLKCFDKW